VASKWQLRDEADLDPADLVFHDFRAGLIELVAPSHIRYEVSSAIRSAVRRKRLPRDEGRSAIEDFLLLGIPTVESENVIVEGYDRALRFGCSLYDGVYVALAESIGCPLIHADHRLRLALGDSYPLAIWIADYPAQRQP